MKKTHFSLKVRQSTHTATYRRVWTDGTRFFVKFEGKVWDVTDKLNWFVHDIVRH